MKTNIEWYPHRKDSHRHPKFKLLRTLYGGGNSGWAMEARFWALNNLIADCEGCVLDISKTRNKAVVAEELGLSLEDLEKFILRLISADLELLYEAAPGKYSTKKVTEALQTTLIEREKSRRKKKERNSSGGKGESSPELLESSPELNDTVKEIRVKEIILEESKGNETDPASHGSYAENSKYAVSRQQSARKQAGNRQYAVGKENAEINLPLTSYSDLNFSSLTSDNLTLESFSPGNFLNEEQVRERIEQMLTAFTKLKPDKATVTSFTNVVCKKNPLTRQVRSETSFKILHKCCVDFASLKKEQQNYGYLYSVFTGRISDALIKAREKAAKMVKREERINYHGSDEVEKVVKAFSTIRE